METRSPYIRTMEKKTQEKQRALKDITKTMNMSRMDQNNKTPSNATTMRKKLAPDTKKRDHVNHETFQKMKREIHVLTQKNTDLGNMAKSCEERANQAMKQNQQLRTRISEAYKDQNELQDENCKLQKIIDEFKAKLSEGSNSDDTRFQDTDDAAVKLKSQLAQLQHRYKENLQLQKQKEDGYKDDISKLLKKLDLETKKADILVSQVDKVMEEKKCKEKETERVKTENHHLKAALEKTQAAQASIQAELDALHERFQSSDKKGISLSEKLEKTSKEKKSLQGQLTKIKTEGKKMLANLEKSREEAVAQYQNEARDLRNLVGVLQEKNAIFSSQLNDVTKEKKSLEQKLQNIQAKADNQLSACKMNAEKSATSLKAELDEFHQRVTISDKKVESLMAELKEVSREKKIAEESLVKAQAEAKKKAAEWKRIANQSMEDQKAEMWELNERLAVASKNTESFIFRFNEVSREKEAVEQKLLAADSEIGKERARRTEAEQKLHVLQKESDERVYELQEENKKNHMKLNSMAQAEEKKQKAENEKDAEYKKLQKQFIAACKHNDSLEKDLEEQKTKVEDLVMENFQLRSDLGKNQAALQSLKAQTKRQEESMQMSLHSQTHQVAQLCNDDAKDLKKEYESKEAQLQAQIQKLTEEKMSFGSIMMKKNRESIELKKEACELREEKIRSMEDLSSTKNVLQDIVKEFKKLDWKSAESGSSGDLFAEFKPVMRNVLALISKGLDGSSDSQQKQQLLPSSTPESQRTSLQKMPTSLLEMGTGLHTINEESSICESPPTLDLGHLDEAEDEKKGSSNKKKRRRSLRISKRSKMGLYTPQKAGSGRIIDVDENPGDNKRAKMTTPRQPATPMPAAMVQDSLATPQPVKNAEQTPGRARRATPGRRGRKQAETPQPQTTPACNKMKMRSRPPATPMHAVVKTEVVPPSPAIPQTPQTVTKARRGRSGPALPNSWTLLESFRSADVLLEASRKLSSHFAPPTLPSALPGPSFSNTAVEALLKRKFKERALGITTPFVFAAALANQNHQKSLGSDQDCLPLLTAIVKAESCVIQHMFGPSGREPGAGGVMFSAYDFSAVDPPHDTRPKSADHAFQVVNHLHDAVVEEDKMVESMKKDPRGPTAMCLYGLYETLLAIIHNFERSQFEEMIVWLKAKHISSAITYNDFIGAANFYTTEFSCLINASEMAVVESPLRTQLANLLSTLVRFHLRRLFNPLPPHLTTPSAAFRPPRFPKGTRSEVWKLCRPVPISGVNHVYGAAADGCMSSIICHALRHINELVLAEAQYNPAILEQVSLPDQREIVVKLHMARIFACHAVRFLCKLLGWPKLMTEIEKAGGWGPIQSLVAMLEKVSTSEDAHQLLLSSIDELKQWLLDFGPKTDVIESESSKILESMLSRGHKLEREQRSEIKVLLHGSSRQRLYPSLESTF